MSYLKILKSFVYFFSLFSVFSAHLAHAQNNLDSLPPECSIFTPVVIPALRSGLYLQRMQISEISATILKNAPTDRKLSHQVAFVIKKQADKALEQALRAVAAFKVIRCTEPTSCQMESLQQEKDRIMFASRKIADVALRLVRRYPDFLGEPAIFVEERIESRFNAFLDGLDFLPPNTYVCN